MPEEATGDRQYHRVPVNKSECPDGDLVTTDFDGNLPEGVKALYCASDETIKTYLFDKDNFSFEEAKEWAADHKDDAAQTSLSLEAELDQAAQNYFQKFLATIKPYIPDAIYSRLANFSEAGVDLVSDPLPLSLSNADAVQRVLIEQPRVLWRMEDNTTQPDFVPEVQENDKGWLRKPILRTGEWPVPPPHGYDPLILTLGHLQMLKDAFDQGAYERVSVPIGHGTPGEDDTEHATRNNAGFVRALEIEGHPTIEGEFQLVAWIQFTDQEIKQKIIDGSIWNVSVLALPNVERPSDGKIFPMALKHVALTNYPWMDGLGSFSLSDSPPLDAEALVLTLVSREDREGEEEGGNPMTEKNTQDPTNDGLSPERLAQLLALEQKQGDLESREQALAEKEAAIKQRAQTLALEAQKRDVRDIVLALEGKETLDGVTTIDGYRHAPAVVAKAEEILLSIQPGAPALRLSRGNGEAEEKTAKELVLELLNAIPASARIKLEQPTAPRPNTNDTEDAEKRGPTTDEEADAALAALGVV